MILLSHSDLLLIFSAGATLAALLVFATIAIMLILNPYDIENI